MCPRSFRNYIIPPREEEEEEEQEITCTKTSALVHIETRAALCVVCYGILPSVDKQSWNLRLKHTLTVGNVIDSIACSSCSRNISLFTNIYHCTACRREYLLYSANLSDNPTTHTDGRVVITLRDDTYRPSEDIPEFL